MPSSYLYVRYGINIFYKNVAKVEWVEERASYRVCFLTVRIRASSTVRTVDYRTKIYRRRTIVEHNSGTIFQNVKRAALQKREGLLFYCFSVRVCRFASLRLILIHTVINETVFTS